MNHTTGILIAFEGVHCSGKSTIARLLAAALRDRGIPDVVEVSEPTRERFFGSRIRELATLGERLGPAEEWALFHADRAELHREIVGPALARGAVVVQDRTYLSSVVYQGARGVDRGLIVRESRAVAHEPDLLFFADVPPEVALRRYRERGLLSFSFVDSASKLTEAREAYLGFAPAPLVLDADRPVEEVVASAMTHVSDLLETRHRRQDAAELERLRVQLAGCDVAYADVLSLRRRSDSARRILEELRASATESGRTWEKTNSLISATLAALNPPYPDREGR